MYGLETNGAGPSAEEKNLASGTESAKKPDRVTARGSSDAPPAVRCSLATDQYSSK